MQYAARAGSALGGVPMTFTAKAAPLIQPVEPAAHGPPAASRAPNHIEASN